MMNREQFMAAWKNRFRMVAGSAVIGAALWLPGICAQAYDGDYDCGFTFSEDGIEAEGGDSGYKISGNELTIQSPGTYLVTGNCTEGSIRIKKETTGVVLILSDLSLKSSETSPLVIAKSAEAQIVIDGNNTLTDAENPANEDSADAEIADAFEGAAIKIKSGATVTFLGDGTLTADGSGCKNGIKGGAETQIVVGEDASDSFTLNAKAANNALAGDGKVTILGGRISLSAEGDGLKASPDEEDTVSAGEIVIRGGTVEINSAEDGIQATGVFTMEGGNVSITSGGGVSGASSLDEDTSAKGIKSDTAIHISGGTVSLDCADDGIHLNGTEGSETISLTGGSITIASGDDGVHSDYYLNIGSESSAGPTVTVTDSCEGLEGAVVNIYSGEISVKSTDDGINAANSDLSSYDFSLNIKGGNVYVNADGDGLDSNGSLYLTGGIAEIYGSSQGDNAPLDYERPGVLSVDGATVLAVGNSGMAENPSEGCYVTFGASGGMGGPGNAGVFGGPGNAGGFGGRGNTGMSGNSGSSSIAIAKGTTIEIRDSSGNVLYTGEGEKSANYVLFASSELTAGESYSLYLNGSSIATATAVGNGSSGQSGSGEDMPSTPETPLTPEVPSTPETLSEETEAPKGTLAVGSDGAWYYYDEQGRIDTQYYGFVSYEDSSFLVAGGAVCTNKNGLVQDPENPDDWYYLANGQVQTQYTGLAEYDGAWFYVNKGKLDTTLAAYVEYDRGLFFVGAGRIMKEVSGLAQDPKGSDWYYLANGQAQTQYTGLAEYDGKWFYVRAGKFAQDYTGEVEYDGAVFLVQNGEVVR